jgi:hypothetical protein
VNRNLQDSVITTADSSASRREHLTFKGNNGQGRHGWLRLTPAYSIHLVRELVSGFTSADLVLDPFCGTGTTALACAERGIPCHTVDINPFLVWLATAKCTQYSPSETSAVVEFARRIQAGGLKRSSAWVPPIQDIQKWWPEPTLDALSVLFQAIAAESNEGTRNMLQIAFCRAAIDTAAVSFGHQSMSFRKDGPQQELFDLAGSRRVIEHFVRAAILIAESAVNPLDANARSFVGDSRHLDQLLPANAYTAVVTSPPYPNRMSYIRELRPYMYWLGYLADGKQAGALDWKAIGGTWGSATSLVGKWNHDPNVPIAWEAFTDCIASIKTHSDLLGRYVHKYFEDAALHINSLNRVLASGSRIFYVVGNSKFYDVLLPTEDIYASQFQLAGFKEISVDRIRKRTSKKELYEYIVRAVKP